MLYLSDHATFKWAHKHKLKIKNVLKSKQNPAIEYKSKIN